MAWRVYVGDMFGPPHDYVHLDATVDSFDLARLIMLRSLIPWLEDDCESCRIDGTDAALQVLGLTEPRAWEGEVEGDAYRIEPTTDG